MIIPLLDPENLQTEKVVLFRDYSDASAPRNYRRMNSPICMTSGAGRSRRSRAKLKRFAFFETAAVLLLSASAVAGVSERFADDSLTKLFQILTIASAIAVVLLPVIFYGVPRTSMRAKRTRSG